MREPERLEADLSTLFCHRLVGPMAYEAISVAWPAEVGMTAVVLDVALRFRATETSVFGCCDETVTVIELVRMVQ